MNSIEVRRTNLYFDQWRFCGRFHLPECHALRRLDHDWIDSIIGIRRTWGRRPQSNYGGSWRGAWESVDISDTQVKALHNMCDFLLTDPEPRKIMIQGDQLCLYTNQTALFQRIQDLGLARANQITEVRLVGVPNTVRLRSCQYALRSYFRSRKLDQRTAESMKIFLSAQASVRLSPSLHHWCRSDGPWLRAHFFLDHHSTAETSMLQIIVPNVIRVTRPIVTDK